MSFSKERAVTLKPQKSKALSTFLLAMAVAAAMFLPYMFSDKGYFLFYGDFNVQQIPFYQRCHELVRSGSLGWDFGTDLGVNFIGSYTFYLLGSPFFWVSLLFPNNFVPYLMGPLLILKFAFCALAAYFYLRRFLRNHETARLGGLLYAFSGFAVYNIFFNHFHEALIVFPLLLLSLELLITENRRGVFALMVGISAITNYFFFFGMVVFAIIYWFVRVLSGAIKVSPARFFVLIFEAVIGLLLSAVLLLPAAAALSGNTRLTEILTGWGAIMYGKEQIYANIFQCFFFPPDLPARPVFFPGADVKWSSLGGWLPIFGMVGVFAFMGNKKGHWLKRVIGIMIFMALVPFLNSAFYMFNSAYYARWYFMPILMMCLATAMAIEDDGIDWHSGFRWCAGITIATTLVIGFMPAAISSEGKITEWGLYVKDSNNLFRDRFFLTCAIALISLLILRVLIAHIRTGKKFFLRGATASVCVMAVIYASVFIGTGKTHSYEDSVMLPLIEEQVELGGDKGDYRIDTYECVDNTGMYFNYNSINAFHSIVPTSVTEFYEFIGEERGVASRPTTKSYAARPLLSVKYLLDLNDGYNFENSETSGMPGFSYLKTEWDYDVYENENYIPYGFTYDYYITREEAQYYGAENAANMMLKALVLEYDQIAKYKNILADFKTAYTFNSPAEEGKSEIYFDDATYAEDCRKLAAGAAHSFKQGKNSFTAEITLNKDNLVFFSIPYEKGWSAYVNGEKAEIEKVNVGFMAVLCQAGANTIEFRYKTPALTMGAVVSCGAAVVLLIYLLISFIYKAKRPAVERYPEGEELLAAWRAAETAEAVLEVQFDEELLAEEEEQPFIPNLPSQQNLFEGGFQVNIDTIKKDIDKEAQDD